MFPNDISLSQVLEKITENASDIDQDGCFPEKAFAWMGDAGLLNITTPGNSLAFDTNTTSELLKLLKKIGKASLPVGRIYEGHINALYLINLFGNNDQKQYWFHQANVKKIFGVWNTQDSHGVVIHDLHNGCYRLEGEKTFCSGAQWLQFPLVTGEMISNNKKGWQMFIIPEEKIYQIKADSSFWKPLGMKASASFRMDFSGIELTENNLLGSPDAYYTQPFFNGGAIRFAAVQLGGAEAVLEETHRLLRSGSRTDDTFQKARIAEMSCLVETGNLWIEKAGNKMDEWMNDRNKTDQLIAYANMARSVIEEVCLKVMQLAERSVGARGLMRPQALERIHRDLTIYLRQPAPDATLTAVGDYVFNQANAINLWSDD